MTFLARTLTPSPVPVANEHSRLGGWREVVEDNRVNALPALSAWAASQLDTLLDLERDGLEAAHGDSLVHFDLYPHNVLITPQRAFFVDWPHARLGNPLIDVLSLLSTVALHGRDPSPYVEAHPLAATSHPRTIDALLAAHAGFCAAGALAPVRDTHRSIRDAKRELASGYLTWLEHRQNH